MPASIAAWTAGGRGGSGPIGGGKPGGSVGGIVIGGSVGGIVIGGIVPGGIVPGGTVTGGIVPTTGSMIDASSGSRIALTGPSWPLSVSISGNRPVPAIAVASVSPAVVPVDSIVASTGSSVGPRSGNAGIAGFGGSRPGRP